ncbi:MAG: hypothetical protein IT366_03980 [Candidatus Hydrogenedentes bacterium]|nr:hypothetical protein [Candidatus Hydrogenedentota bacterium]
MRRLSCLYTLPVILQFVFALASMADHNAVHIETEKSDKHRLAITGKTYSMLLNCTDAVIERFRATDQELIGDVPLCPTFNTGKVNGPATVEITQDGPVFAEIHLRDLWWTDLNAKIELVLYCHPTRVYATVVAIPEGTAPDMMVGWYGATKFSMPLVMQSEAELQKQASFNGQNPKCAAVVAEPWIQFGKFDERLRAFIKYGNSTGTISGGYGYPSASTLPRRASIILIAARSNDELKEFIRGEAALSFAKVNVSGALFDRYDGSAGLFRIKRDFAAGDLKVDVAFAQPPPAAPLVLTIKQRVALALSKIDWRLGIVQFTLLAIIIFGFRATPTPGTFGARVRPKLLASLATLLLFASIFWLFRPPPPPPPVILPMPQQPVTAAFEVNESPAMPELLDENGAPLHDAIQLHSSTGETLVASFTHPILPESRAVFTLRNEEPANASAPSRSP